MIIINQCNSQAQSYNKGFRQKLLGQQAPHSAYLQAAGINTARKGYKTTPSFFTVSFSEQISLTHIQKTLIY